MQTAQEPKTITELQAKIAHLENECGQSAKDAARYRTLIESIPDPVVLYDIHGLTQYVNPEFTRVFGWSIEDLRGKRIDFVPLEELEKTRVAIEALVSDQQSCDLETKRLTRSGEVRDVKIKGAIYHGSDGAPMGSVVIIRDVTALKREEVLEWEREQRFKAVMETAADPIVLYDMKGAATYVNPAFTKTFGWRPEEVLGRRLDFVPPEAMAETVEAVRRVVLGGEAKLDTRRLTKANGTIDVSLSAVTFPGPDGSQAGMVVILRDISKAKRHESELKAAREQAEAANKSKSEFLANMSHEVRTPMNAIMGMATLLIDTELSETQKDYINIIRTSSDALLGVINDILDFSKIEAGKMEMEILDFDLRTSLEEIVVLPAIKAQEKGVEFTYDIADEVPSSLRGDPGRLRQIILNLSNNATKFTQHGEILLQVSLIEETQTRVKLKFAVKDTGIGISEKDISRLFSSFHQVDASTTRQYGGTGLGLAISKQLAKLMGGEIGVESRKGSGSTFWFTAVFEKQLHVKEKRLITPEDLIGKRILVVDDNKTNLTILKGYIESWGWVCDIAWSAEMALTMMRAAHKYNAPYDILLSDWQMPIMDGLELGRTIKSDPALKDILMLILSSRGMRGDAATTKEIGFNAYLTKPVRRSHLFDCLVMVLSRKTYETDERPQLVTRHTISEERKHRIRILIAEDNIVNQKLALLLLEKWGFRADAVANGLEAVRSLEIISYDIVLMDIQMPEMDGFEATRIIRDPESKVIDHRVPIIAMTAHAMRGDKERCLESGMDSYVSKPIQPKELLKEIEAYLSREKEKKAGSSFLTDFGPV